MKNFLLVLFIQLFLSLTCLSQKSDCADAYSYAGYAFEAESKRFEKNFITKIVKEKLPGFYRRIGDRKVPVLLIDGKNFKTYQKELDEGVSQVLALTGRGNDHGQLLLGAKEMSERSFYSGGVGNRSNVKHGLNDTGILVKDFEVTLQRNVRANYLIFFYKATGYEKDIALYYSRTRRAGLFHVENGFNPGEPIPNAFQRICKGAEKCHNYISSTDVHQEQIDYMKFLIWKYGNETKSADEFLGMDIVKQIQDKARERVVNLDLERYFTNGVGEKGILYGQEQVLNPRMFHDEEFLGLVNQVLPNNINLDIKLKFINSVVGINALEEYKIFSRALGVNKYDPWPDHLKGNSRLSAIFVVQPEGLRGDPEAFLKSFYEGTYENFHGANHHHLGDWKKWNSPIFEKP